MGYHLLGDGGVPDEKVVERLVAWVWERQALIGPLAGGLIATLVAFCIAGALALVARNMLSPKP